ncbi:histone-lysine N-methyltransferase 2C isoform X2 [Rhea pennata]|uniref:histone-lysine N-methyltransferase 2C isoform X2 n=1 Tax=Rhea pennata TaxID=8795 RepID=UPI002E265E07
MSTEDKSLVVAVAEPPQQQQPPEPGAPPPAAAAAAAAATDKRPRGRPRKDGASPFQRARKKPRSRGKTAVEDEDSMDGLEAAETENTVETEVKEQSAEEDAQTEVDSTKQLTPILQRSVSEESASSTASVGVEAKTSEQLCAFCYCGERSSLGQGDLKQFSPTPGYIIPWKNQPLPKSEGSDSADGACERTPRQNAVPRKQRGHKKSRSSIASCSSVSTQTASDDQVVKFWDELSLVGLPDDIDVQALFEPTGHCWAHHRCAEWSLGVCQTEEQLSVNVDKAVVSGSTERCAYCKHLGATIKCCEEKCTQMYHYPCAAGAGTFQDFSNLSLLCPDHIDQAPERSKEEANCAVCDSPGDLLDQLFCTTCGQHYHGMCLDIQVTPLKRAGWQCPDCKVCQNCKHSGEDNKMLVCDTCDKGYHTFCLQPVMDSVPTNGWKCKNCRVCAECGTRTSCQWHHNCLVCDSCYQQQDNLPCPFCEKLCLQDFQKDMLHCHMCKRWIHIECDRSPDSELESQLKDYICTLCKQGEGDQIQSCDVMDTSELIPEPDSIAACTNEMDIESGAEDLAFQEQTIAGNGLDQESTVGCVTDVTGISLEEKTTELETEVCDEVNSAEMEMSPKKTPALDDSQTEKMMEGVQAVLQQDSDEQVEETQLSQDSVEVSEVSTVDSRSLSSVPETVTVMPEIQGTESKGEICIHIEQQLEIIEVQKEVEKGETLENSETPAVREVKAASANEGLQSSSPVGDKPIKSPADTYPSLPSSVNINKTSMSSSPDVSLDLHSSRDVQHSQPPALTSTAGSALTTTYISVTPKIGMGKPAITKRKFSPGRPRSRQGAWSTNNTVSPPSWSPDISEGRDIFKSRQLPGSAIWSIKVGRGSGFPGKRRPRGAGLSGRGGRGRSKLKNGVGTVVIPGVTTMDVSSNKDEEENSMHNTVVLFSNSDKFTLHQDMCVVCGSFGQGAEGRLLACSQCGQCYHPYCVSIKITKVVLSKGWRCLECTVCEACGKATDPGRLLLCDDCDISYHTYCLDPPLQTVPKGGWKCKWCVWCRHCGATSPGLRCEWQNNYTQCAPCASLSTCPICYRTYRDEELIIQCRQCDRWMHAICQNLNTEEEVENIADMGFDCTICRPYIPPTNVPSLDCCDSSVGAQIISKSKELDPPKTYTQDGVCLTESGMSQLQSLTVTVPRRKRTKPKLKLKIINQNSVAVLQTPPDAQSEHSRDGEMDDSRGDLMDCDGKSDSSPEREAVDDDTKAAEGADGIKKRKRKPYRPGIGGFMVRQRSRTGQGKTKRSLSRKDSSGSVSEQLPGRDEGWTEQLPDTPVEESAPASESTEKIKKRYRKKKNKLEETFPAYLQEAFFGKDLLDTSRQNKMSLDNLPEESLPLSCKTNLTTSFLDPSSDPLLSSTSTPAQSKLGAQGSTDDPLADLSEVLNTDDDILGILSDDLVKSGDHSGLDLCTFQVENSPSPFAGLDIGPISDDPSSLPQPNINQSSRPLSEEQLDGILSPELDKMVTDGAILGKLYKIPELGGKDVEDLFTAVLSPATTQPAPLPQPPPPPQLMSLHTQGENAFSRVPLMNGLIGPNPHLPHTALTPGGGLGTFSPITQQPYTDTRDKNPAFSPMVSDPNSSWAPSAPPLEGEGDTMSNAQRSTLKWEKEEALGEMATVAPVLYTNINFPNLKEEFPDWATRVKQIAKLWRKASSQERAPYVQKARDNRAALRINKVQMSNDSMKRQQQQDSIDPSSRIDSDLFKDPLKQRESEHEQEWKFRQQMRQKSKQQAKIEATQKLEQVKNEQQQQQQQQQQFGSQQLLNQSGSDTPSSGIQSPLTPQTGNGSMSPAQQTFHKDLFTKQQLPATPTSASSDDVFLKPQAPPPTPTRIPVHDSLSQSQTPQTSSQQMFSPGSTNTRPPSPMDPYAKMVGTPRPAPINQNFVRRNTIAPLDTCAPQSSVSRPIQVTEPSGSRPSPVRDSCSSSPGSSDPYAKPPDTPRPVMASDQFSKPLGVSRSPIVMEQSGKGSLPAGSSDPFTKPAPRTDTFQRQRVTSADAYARPPLTPTPVDGSPGPFKTPMRPPQSPQDPYGSMPATPRRVAVDPYERPALTPRPVDNFSHNQPSDPYNQPPLTPHPAIKETTFAHPPRIMRQQSDSFPQSGPISRPASQDPYSQPPGTPRPVADPYAQPPGTPRPTTVDPYMQQPPTPRPAQPADLFAQSSANQRHSDPYAQPPGTPRPVLNDPYSHQPATPRPGVPESFNRPAMTRPGLMPNRDPFLQTPQNRLQGTFVRPSDPCSQSPRPAAPAITDSFSHGPAAAARDPYDQPPLTPRPQPESFGTSQLAHDTAEQPRPGSEGNFSASANSPMSSQAQQFPKVSQVPGPAPTTGVTDTQNTMNMSQADTEKLRQRQKLREIILQQQQQKKNAVRQEKALQDPAASGAPHGAPLQHWQQDNLNQIFNRPPPPYPGNIRSSVVPPGGPRFTVFPKDQRGPFPVDGQFNRPQFPRDMNAMGMRPHGLRFGFPGGGHGPPSGQERFLGPQQPMQRPGVPPQLRRSLSVDMPRPANNPQINNSSGIPQHFPPQGIQVQQHNILGQAFIELRHRAPDGRPRLPFNPSATNVMDAAPHQRHASFIPRQEFPGPRQAEPLRHSSQGISSQLRVSTSLEHMPQSQQDQINSDNPPALVISSLSHPPVADAFPGPSLPTSAPSEESANLQVSDQPADSLEEKLDPDDPAVKDLDVKDLDGVEVKDLDDEDLENLNLDTEDGKGDELDTLDNLETNDPHLDDLLRSGEFDIIAYTDPELDLGDKKGMFNEELDLGVPIDDKLDIQSKTEEPKQKEQGDRIIAPSETLSPQKKSATESEIKTEVLSPNTHEEKKNENEKGDGNNESTSTQQAAEMEIKDGEKASMQPANPEFPDKTPVVPVQETTVPSSDAQGSAPLPVQGVASSCNISGSTPVLSSLLANESSDNSEARTLGSPAQSLPATQMNHSSGIPQTLMTPGGQILENTLNTNLTMVPRINHNFSQGSPNPGFMQGQSANHNFGPGQTSNQTVTVTNRPGPSSLSGPQQIMLPQPLAQQQNRERPLLLEEQPLLLQDLLDQERQEQQQQRQMQAMIRQRSEPFFPNIDFDAITDPIMKAKMVALKGINKVMAQSNMGMPPMVMNRFPFMGQSVPGAQTSEGQNHMQQAITQDGNLTPQISRPNPPNFGPGFVNDSQRKQYEEWLQETQQLLQMQQKYLEEQIGAHRKSKKALSAKQRTAKKAGREFPEEDAEQLKHVTEQQSMVQKQLEQIRKQQKEHAELIEEYRIKQQQQQQQCGMAPHTIMPGVQAQPPMVPGGTSPAMSQQNFPMVAQQLQHQQHTVVIPGQSNPTRMPNLSGWQSANAPTSHISINPARMQPPMTPLPITPATPTPVPGPNATAQSGPPPRVEFDDNNPFSESFQERERKERLREQQERQRIQLMQEVDRQRALQQRMELEQHGMIGSELNNRASLSQIPFFNSDLPCDFIQAPRPLQQSPQHQQQQMGQILQQGPVNSPPATNFMQSSERRPVGATAFGPDASAVPSGAPNFHTVKQTHGNLPGATFAQNQVRPPFAPASSSSTVLGSGPSCAADTSIPQATNFPGSNQSLIQLYSDIIPEEKGKKKRTRKKKKDDDTESIKAPSTPHSDITAPSTPTISDSTSTPAVNTPNELSRHQEEQESVEITGRSTSNAAEGQTSPELDCKLPDSSLPQKQLSENTETEKAKTDSPSSIQEVKVEKAETDQCSGQAEPKAENPNSIKVEEDKVTSHPASSAQSPTQPASIPAAKGESGNELLKHLLKNKKSSSLLSQKSENSCPTEEESAGDKKLTEKQNPPEGMQTTGNQMQGVFGCSNSQLQRADVGQETKKQRNKRTQRTGEKAAPRSKKRKKEEEEKQAVYPNADTFIQLKQQLSLLPLMEPIIGVSFAHFLPYGSGQLNGGNQLVGSFGSATLDGTSDYYSQLIYKQNNLSNPPTPPASLPPTPPPVACQKLVNGFATTEELAGKAVMLGGHDVTKALGPKQFQLPFRPQDDLLARAMAQGPKTVDVPASLPTPPHNNQEELRVQDHCEDRDTPDSFVPSSSPESVVGMEISRYPDLSVIKEENPEPVPSPIIPILPSSTGKGSEAKRNYIKSEPGSGALPGSGFFASQLGPSQNGPKSGLISVAITLHPTAAENISNVVAAFSNLLHVRIPNSYEVSNAPDVPSAMGAASSHRMNPSMEYRQHLLFQGPQAGSMGSARLVGSYGLKQPSVPFPANSNGIGGCKDHSQNIAESSALRPRWCSHCKVVVLGSGVRKSFRDLPFPKQDSQESSDKMKDIVFCSNNCFVLYSAAVQAKNSENKESVPSLPQSPMKERPPKAFHQYSNNISTLDVHCLPQLQEKVSPPSSPPIMFPPAFEAAKVEAKPDELKVTVKLKPRLKAIHSSLDDCRPPSKKWKGMKWKKWSIQIVIPKGSFKPPCEEEIDEFLKKLGTTLKPDPVPKDYRKCCFCHEEGDGLTDGPARLLNLDLDLWVHLNCALWSTEVYETQAGALINVELALRRGLQMKCMFCHKMGATSGCHRLRCTNIYHFTCAIKAQCMFFKDKTMLCPMHKPKGTHEQELSYFAVFRRVYVQRDEVRQIASIVQRGERDHTFRVGSLIFHAIGQLLPQQMQAFHSSKALFPVGYEASRLYWSMRYANRRCRYLCSIEEKDGLPLFVIKVVEQGHEDLVLTDTTPKGVWDKILEPVASVRKESEMLQLFPGYLKGEDLFGLTVSAVARIAESLPGVEACENYTFRYGRNPLMELPLAINPTGCARAEPKMSTHVKRFVLRPHTLNSTSTSKSFQSTVTGELNAPYSKQFVHSKSSQYRKMKTEWKSNVYLARSRIQGLGLYAARDIEKHTMVIEYIGTIIRNEVANRKEKLYESQNRGVYMFRIDNDHVIDATLTGGPARYINHSCAPNCVAEVVTFERGHKIIISSSRRIQKGEELCYDYKFDFEDDQHKIPCHCGAVNCRKWMN